MAPDLSLVLACYNEEPLFAESAALILAVLNQTRLSYEIIFVDDASQDGTKELIQKACSGKIPIKHTSLMFRAIYHRSNKGRGRTVADGIRAAKGRVVGYIDIDCEVSPVYIPEMAARVLGEKTDVVIGKRIYRTTISSLHREIMSMGYRWLLDKMIGTGGMDTETGYKFFNRKKIMAVLAKATHPGWFWDTEIMVYAQKAGLRITEVPVLFMRRTDKSSSVRVWRDIPDYVRSLFLLRKRLKKE